MSTNNITREECSRTNKEVMEKIEEVKKEVGKINLQMARLPKALADEFDKRYATKNTEEIIKAFDERFATKKTEKTVDKVVWLIIVAVIVAILNLIIP